MSFAASRSMKAVPVLRRFAGAVFALALGIAASPAVRAADDATRVETASGPVQGIAVEGGVVAYRGLPYAAPPVGALRWKAPQPAPRWSDVRVAAKPGAACPQERLPPIGTGGDLGAIDEDCLTINVWTPRADRDARLPVMVWIHGGAYVIGSGGQPVYDGALLARRGVVVVTFNYRLGALGFFDHPALEREQHGHARAMNFGLLDQVAALRWVQGNIAAFGGDPHEVTIFGESAGAQSVLALYASPEARGLFARGIAQSPYGIPAHTAAKARASGIAVADALGLGGASATAEQLRAVPFDRLVASKGKDLSLAPLAIVGDRVLPEAPLAGFEHGREARAPLVIGSNSDEASVALAFGIDPAALVKRLGAARIVVRPLYPSGTDDASLGRQLVRDIVFTAFAKRIAALHGERVPTWRYYFSRIADAAPAEAFGVEHGGEIASVFGTGATCGCLAAAPSEADRAAAARLGDRWVAFAKHGVPDAGAAPDWPRDRRATPRVLEFGDETVVHEAFMGRRLDVLVRAVDIAGGLTRSR